MGGGAPKPPAPPVAEITTNAGSACVVKAVMRQVHSTTVKSPRLRKKLPLPAPLRVKR